MKKSIQKERIVIPVKQTAAPMFQQRSDAQEFLHHTGAGVHKAKKGKGSFTRKPKHRLDMVI